MKRLYFLCLLALFVTFDPSVSSARVTPPLNKSIENDPVYKASLALFEEVYKTMLKNYYKGVPVEEFKKFLYIFNKKIYPEMRISGKSPNYIKWRSAAYMVKQLRDDEDIFSAFIPPQFAKKYEEKVLGKKIDLGIEGELGQRGFMVKFVEPRSNAYEKGLRESDIVKAIDGESVVGLTQDSVEKMLTPLEGKSVALKYLDVTDKQEKTIHVLSEEYFKQTVFMVPVDVPGIYALQIKKFNRRTAEDMTPLMEEVLKNHAKGLILDLRGNPGGPPLAARQVAAFFLTPNEEFAYFQMHGTPQARLFVPRIPSAYRFQGDIVILVNKQSGSAAELFSGIMQGKNRAALMGQSTAGQVMLKSMFHLEDGSMVLLVTGRGHYPDGKVFSFSGLQPDRKTSKEEKDAALIHEAAEYLVSLPKADKLTTEDN